MGVDPKRRMFGDADLSAHRRQTHQSWPRHDFQSAPIGRMRVGRRICHPGCSLLTANCPRETEIAHARQTAGSKMRAGRRICVCIERMRFPPRSLREDCALPPILAAWAAMMCTRPGVGIRRHDISDSSVQRSIWAHGREETKAQLFVLYQRPATIRSHYWRLANAIGGSRRPLRRVPVNCLPQRPS